MLGWLFGPSLFAVAAAYLVSRIFDTLVSEATAATNAARGALFTSAWAAVTARSGMGNFTKSVRRLRLRGLGVINKIDDLTKDDRR